MTTLEERLSQFAAFCESCSDVVVFPRVGRFQKEAVIVEEVLRMWWRQHGADLREALRRLEEQR